MDKGNELRYGKKIYFQIYIKDIKLKSVNANLHQILKHKTSKIFNVYKILIKNKNVDKQNKLKF